MKYANILLHAAVQCLFHLSLSCWGFLKHSLRVLPEGLNVSIRHSVVDGRNGTILLAGMD